jgi:hypothetical protein
LAPAASDGQVLFLSDTVEGSAHDKAIADDVPSPLSPGSALFDDFRLCIARRRIVIEHAISGIKRCRIVKDTIRLWKGGAIW